MSNKGRLVSRPTEDAALARCKHLGMKIDEEVLINHYKGLYGLRYMTYMPASIRNLIGFNDEKIHKS